MTCSKREVNITKVVCGGVTGNVVDWWSGYLVINNLRKVGYHGFIYSHERGGCIYIHVGLRSFNVKGAHIEL